MALDLRALNCFVAIAEEGSFSRAAQRLRLTQPTVSSHVQDLEREIGVALFMRSTRRVAITREGAELLPEARRLLRDAERLERAVNRLRRQGSGRLRLGAALYTIFVAERLDLVDRFVAGHPDLKVDIVNRWQAELMRDLVAGTLDLVLSVGCPIPQAEFERQAARRLNGELVYPDHLPRIVLRREPMRLLVPVQSPLAAYDTVPLAALRGMPVATLAEPHGLSVVGPINELLDAAGAEPILPPEGNALAVERFAARRAMPAIGMGWFSDGDIPGLTARKLEGLTMTTDLVLLASLEDLRPAAQIFWNSVEAAAGGA